MRISRHNVVYSETHTSGALGRQVSSSVSVADGAGSPVPLATYTAYNAENQVVSTWGATYPVAYAYDSYGRMTAMNTFRNEAMQNGDTTTWLYDDATGLLTNKVYSDGKGPSYTYTSDGKLATRTWARGLTTTYAYNTPGQLTTIDYSDGTPDVAFTYDRLGRQLSAIAAGVSTNLYAYSLYGQLTNEVVSGNASLSRTYDTLGRSTGLSLSPLPLGEGQGEGATPYSVAYAYDTYGRFASVTSINSQFSILNSQFTYSYLPGSSLVSGMSASSGHAWTRSYEPNRNLIAAVTNRYGSTVISAFGYANDEIGRRTAISRSGTAFDTPVRDAYGYNARSEVTSARRALADSPNQGVRGFSYDYAYDPIGNRTSSTEYDHENHARVSSYTANELNQYEQRTVPSYAGVRGSATNNATVTVNGNTAWRLGEYFYGGDDVDNAASAVMKELDITAVVNPSGTNNADIVESVTGKVYVAKSPEAFTYDDDGNMLSDGRFNYTWDGENRLASIETSAAAASSGALRVKVVYTYDNRSRRIGKVVSHFENDTWTVAESRAFLYDGWNMVQETISNPQSAISNSFVWGLDLSSSLQGAGGVGGLLAVIKDSATYSPAWDANGNVMEYVSDDGTLAAHYEYSPFGETVIQSGDMADSFAFRFSTKYWESEAKLYYYGYRYYAPGIGRWLNRDPIEEVGGLNLHALISNNLIDKFDLLGLKCSITVLYGHGSESSSYDPKNWLINKAYDLFKTMDETDRVALLGCVSTQVRDLLFERLLDQAGPSQDIIDAVMKWLEVSLDAGVNYTIKDDDTWFRAFLKVIDSVDLAAKEFCQKGCCKDVYVEFVCQEDDTEIAKQIPIVDRMNRAAVKYNKPSSPALANLPEGETFCGKTWRHSCEGDYNELWTWSHRN